MNPLLSGPPQNDDRRASLLLTPHQVASRLQVSPSWVRDHATRKLPKIPSVKVGKLLRFKIEDIDQFIHEQRDWTRREDHIEGVRQC
jgi:excisionase family DNA binding protein